MIDILQEETYAEEMKNLVEPYLREHMKELWLEREFGKRIHCIQYIAEEAKGILVISHGYTESAAKYREMAYYFLKQNYHVWIPEHCGHGHSYRLVEDLSLVHVDRYDRYVDDLWFVAGRAKLEYMELPVYLFGHSMGGGIAAAAAAKTTGLFQKVILSSPMIRPLEKESAWLAAKNVSLLLTKAGKGESYAAGQHSYEGIEEFETGAATSEARHNYYEEIRAKQDFYQTCACSYGWMAEASHLHDFLQKKGWKQVEVPMIIFQAEEENLVSKQEQEIFARKIAKADNIYIRLIHVPEAKHEIYRSENKILRRYFTRILDFLENV